MLMEYTQSEPLISIACFYFILATCVNPPHPTHENILLIQILFLMLKHLQLSGPLPPGLTESLWTVPQLEQNFLALDFGAYFPKLMMIHKLSHVFIPAYSFVIQ